MHWATSKLRKSSMILRELSDERHDKRYPPVVTSHIKSVQNFVLYQRRTLRIKAYHLKIIKVWLSENSTDSTRITT